MVRQYIGARYVPRFRGDYDATTAYEALDVVDNGMGTSYIAKKPVPVGTPLSNTEYWFIYGASSGAIYDLQTRMSNAENDIDNLEDNISEVTLSDATRMTEIKDRCYLFFGDSFDSSRSISERGWIDPLCEKLGITDYIKLSRGSYGFVGFIEGYTWLSLAIGLSDANKAKITDVFIGGDAADFRNDPSGVMAAMQTLDTWLRSNLPKLKSITFAFLSYLYSTITDEIVNQWTMYHYVRNKAQDLGWKWIEGSNLIISDPRTREDAMDTLHPNALGVQRISQYLTEAIQGRNIQFDATYTMTGSIGNSFGTISDVTFYCNIMNGFFQYATQTHKYLTIASNLNDTDWYDLYTTSKEVPVYGVQTTIPIMVIDTNSEYHSGFAIIRLKNRNTIAIRFMGSRTAYLASGGHIIIPPFTQNLPLNSIPATVS